MNKKIVNLTTEEVSEVINLMFSTLSLAHEFEVKLNVSRQSAIFNMIDDFMMNDLEIKKEDMPWHNKNKITKENFVNVLNLIRLSYARLFQNFENSFINKLH